MNYAHRSAAFVRFCVVLVFGVIPLCGGAAGLENTSSRWWSLQPLLRPAIPKPHHAGENPIDSFIGRKLHEAGLQPSAAADRHALIRRLYFDLTGLPPSPEEVQQFQLDENPRAYEVLVEQLLASSRYGERWARHWLDVVRFAETHGFEMNQPRPNAWPYRDYVIASFNDDKPYDQFVLEQLAGDVFGRPQATGFLVGGPWDQVKSPDPVLTANQRADELHDIVSTTASTFLGLTVGCARCHDHKFDPIPQVDYYAMKAVFEGVQHGEQKLQEEHTAERERQLKQFTARLAALELELDSLEPLAEATATTPRRTSVHPRRNVDRITPTSAKRLRFTVSKTTDVEPCIDELEVYIPDGRNAALAAHGTTATASSVYPNSEIHRLEHINDGRHGNGRSWISNERGAGWVELQFPQPIVIDRIVWGRDREGKYADRLPTEYRIEAATGDGGWQLIASSADRFPYSPEAKNAEPRLNELSPADSEKVQGLRAERKDVSARIDQLSKVPMVYSGTFKSDPDPTHLLHRGDPMIRKEQVNPGALSAIQTPLQIGETIPGRELTPDQQRRLALAKWIVDPQNPLTARVMVNRIWQYHFGKGLVSTPSDFGANGAKPSHPELLDWLASEFIDSGWSIKHLHRLIVTSATYRQSSAAHPESIALDADTRLLWRFPPRRLEAEAIRDSILAVSGQLDLRMGGPGFSFFEPNENYVRVYTPRTDWDPETFRRMLYGTVVRQRPDGVFGVFDCPDAGQIAPKRTSSTTPLQALNLLNSSFLLQQAEFFAERLGREAGPSPKAQVNRAFALAFQREPSPEELETALEMVGSHGLVLFCRALLNANEFIYVF